MNPETFVEIIFMGMIVSILVLTGLWLLGSKLINFAVKGYYKALDEQEKESRGEK